jgi:hypothetical protein
MAGKRDEKENFVINDSIKIGRKNIASKVSAFSGNIKLVAENEKLKLFPRKTGKSFSKLHNYVSE